MRVTVLRSFGGMVGSRGTSQTSLFLLSPKSRASLVTWTANEPKTGALNVSSGKVVRPMWSSSLVPSKVTWPGSTTW